MDFMINVYEQMHKFHARKTYCQQIEFSGRVSTTLSVTELAERFDA